MPIHASNNVRILPGTHLYTWVESSNVDKVSCWRTKSARHWRESHPQPFDPESRVHSNIPRHLHNVIESNWAYYFIISFVIFCLVHWLQKLNYNYNYNYLKICNLLTVNYNYNTITHPCSSEDEKKLYGLFIYYRDVPLFRKFPEIMKFQIHVEKKNFRKKWNSVSR